eukprot:TRINITY_DN2651_c0_g3_i1.p1 TRINITY_DN2651_c0_g3~~TRINITY_DN2651_c0_g3_i1.p1  ORF type:complete len:673 (+),score=157.87 TRINITY_DN2651_c0_g3_i1:80-2098(+)
MAPLLANSLSGGAKVLDENSITDINGAAQATSCWTGLGEDMDVGTSQHMHMAPEHPDKLLEVVPVHSDNVRAISYGCDTEPRRGERQFSTMSFLFPDAEQMKMEVRASLLKPEPYSVTNFYKPRSCWTTVATHPIFENVTLAVIGANALWIAIDTDNNTATSLIEADPVFQVAENLFCTYFSVEWFVRFMSFARKRDGLKDGWFVFDTLLVGMMVMETWLLTSVQLLLAGRGGGGAMGNASILRLFRLMRLSRMARMLRSMPELLILIKGMVSAMRSVFFVMCLQVVILYIFGIAFKQLSDGTEFGATYFTNVPMSMYSLLVYGTFLDALSDFCADLMAESHVCLFLAIVFIILSALTVMNMLIGVLCEVISAVAETEKEQMLVNWVSDKLHDILAGLDDDNNGRLSQRELMQMLRNKEAVLALEEVGVDPVGLVDFASVLFEGSEEVTFENFMDRLLQLRGSNTATVKDVLNLWKQISARLEASAQLAGLRHSAPLDTQMLKSREFQELALRTQRVEQGQQKLEEGQTKILLELAKLSQKFEGSKPCEGWEPVSPDVSTVRHGAATANGSNGTSNGISNGAKREMHEAPHPAHSPAHYPHPPTSPPPVYVPPVYGWTDGGRGAAGANGGSRSLSPATRERRASHPLSPDDLRSQSSGRSSPEGVATKTIRF